MEKTKLTTTIKPGKSLNLLPLILISLVFITVSSYIYFQTNLPKLPTVSPDVKGYASTEFTFDFPLPTESERIGSNQTSETKQVTISSSKTPEEIQQFYKNIFSVDKWELDSEGHKDGFLLAKYKLSDKVVTILSSRQPDDNYTIASIVISKR